MLINCLLRFIVSTRFWFLLIWHLCQPKRCFIFRRLFGYLIFGEYSNFLPRPQIVRTFGSVIAGVSSINHGRATTSFFLHALYANGAARITQNELPLPTLADHFRTHCTLGRYGLLARNKGRYSHFSHTLILAFLQVVATFCARTKKKQMIIYSSDHNLFECKWTVRKWPECVR